MLNSCSQAVYKLRVQLGKIAELFARLFSESFLCAQISYLYDLFALLVRDLYPAVFLIITPLGWQYSTVSTNTITKETNLTKG